MNDYTFNLRDHSNKDYGIMETKAKSCKHAFVKVSHWVRKMFPEEKIIVSFRGFESEFDSFVRRHRDECYDEDGDFDWGEYQHLCDIADYWDMDA